MTHITNDSNTFTIRPYVTYLPTHPYSTTTHSPPKNATITPTPHASITNVRTTNLIAAHINNHHSPFYTSIIIHITNAPNIITTPPSVTNLNTPLHSTTIYSLYANALIHHIVHTSITTKLIAVPLIAHHSSYDHTSNTNPITNDSNTTTTLHYVTNLST